MISSYDRDRRPLTLIKLGLIATSVVLFCATAALSISQSQQRALLSATIRSSGWVAYQAELEFVRAEAEFAKSSVMPTAAGMHALETRLEILRSRLPLLYDSDEGRVLREVVDVEGPTRAEEARLDTIIDKVEQLDPEDGEAGTRLRELDASLQPLGQMLHQTLMQSVAYNKEIFHRERELAHAPGVVPLVLLFISGTCLAAVLFLQARRDRMRLKEIVEAQSAVNAMDENLRAVIEAVPACMVVIDPNDHSVSFINPSAAELVARSLDDPAWPAFVKAALDACGAAAGTRWGALSMAYARSEGDMVSLRGTLCNVLWERRQQLLLVLVDTTRVRNAELQVMQAAKLATLGEMATAIAHELNQPLAVIKMAVANARRLADDPDGRDAVKAKLDRISAQVDRAKRITDQVRRYGRMPTEQLRAFPLRAAVELAVGFVAEQYRAANIRLFIVADIPVDLCVFGEQTMFEQVLEARLEPVMQQAGMDDMSRLVATLRDERSASLANAVVEAMTTNESLFFRDKQPFELMSSLMLPALAAARSAHHTLRIWCAAASTGQEPYSIAMLLKENERLLGGRRVEIIATDLSTEVLDRARKGVYNQFEVQRGLPVHYLLRYFTQIGDMWQIAPAIRSMVRFSQLNLLQPFTHLGLFDIVFCRNVLIYFDTTTKADVLDRLAAVMGRDAYLVLGGAETVLGLSSAFVAGSQRGFYVPRS